MCRRSKAAWTAVVWAALVVGAGSAQELDSQEETVLFGQSAPLSGPAQQLGSDFRAGILAAFTEANRKGGVHGRKLSLLSLDDSYEPDRALANTKSLIEEHNVFALIGSVGTPTTLVAVPVAADAGVPFIAPMTGAEFLRDDHWTNVVNLRASYFQETREIVTRLVEDLGIERIAVLGRDPSNWRPADPEAWELRERMADAIADGYADEDWRRVLNSLNPSRAARDIACRPPEDRRRLLMLIDRHRRGEVERLLVALAA